jgi:hypothetical protein
MALTTCPQLAPRFKKDQNYTSTPPLGFMAYSRVKLYYNSPLQYFRKIHLAVLKV